MKTKISLLVATLLLTTITLQAQDAEFNPHPFVQWQDGANYNLDKADFSKLIATTAQVAVGYQFNPVLGLRLGVNGWKAKGGFSNNDTYEWKYIAPALDFRIDLVNAIGGYRPNRVFSLGLLLGGGVNIAWDNDDNARPYGLYAISPVSSYFWTGTQARFVGRAGLDLDFKVNKWVSINLEAMANGLSDKYNSRQDSHNNIDLDWYFTGLLGLKINLSNPQRDVQHVAEEPIRPLSLYEQMQAGVNERMNTWMKRLKGESKADYLARTTDAAIQTQRLDYTKAISTDMAGNRVNTSLKDLQYNKAAGLLGVQFTDMPSITLRVPESEISSIKGT
ncbi:MAG: hypothetical protein IJT75_06980, partial [Bacteroidaceae bacterium]|nr:hypothetical protein [Bacteroidaceae bacterium]